MTKPQVETELTSPAEELSAADVERVRVARERLIRDIRNNAYRCAWGYAEVPIPASMYEEAGEVAPVEPDAAAVVFPRDTTFN